MDVHHAIGAKRESQVDGEGANLRPDGRRDTVFGAESTLVSEENAATYEADESTRRPYGRSHDGPRPGSGGWVILWLAARLILEIVVVLLLRGSF